MPRLLPRSDNSSVTLRVTLWANLFCSLLSNESAEGGNYTMSCTFRALRSEPAVGRGLVGVELAERFVPGVAVHETEVAAR